MKLTPQQLAPVPHGPTGRPWLFLPGFGDPCCVQHTVGETERERENCVFGAMLLGLFVYSRVPHVSFIKLTVLSNVQRSKQEHEQERWGRGLCFYTSRDAYLSSLSFPCFLARGSFPTWKHWSLQPPCGSPLRFIAWGNTRGDSKCVKKKSAPPQPDPCADAHQTNLAIFFCLVRLRHSVILNWMIGFAVLVCECYVWVRVSVYTVHRNAFGFKIKSARMCWKKLICELSCVIRFFLRVSLSVSFLTLFCSTLC